MTRTVRVSASLALAIVLGCLSAAPRAADDKKPDPGPVDADVSKLAEQTSQLIQTALKGDPDDAAVTKARTAAVVLAAVAQYGTPSTERAAIRDAALRVAGALRAGKLDDARKQAGELARPAANANAKKEAVPLLGKEVSFHEAMVHFALKGAGGTDGERKLLALGNNKTARQKKEIPAKELNDDLLSLAYRAAALADLSKGHKDATVQKNPKAWAKYAEETRQSALDLAAAVRDKKGEQAWTALNRLNSACYSCHSEFGR